MAVPIPEKRIAEFEKMGFGMFVHWGLYSQIGEGEWYFANGYNGTMEEYKKLADTFTAEDFDPDKLVLTAKNAGCKYIVLTTRHHEGFSLYDTCGLNDFDAPHSGAKRDLVKEYVDSCRRHGIKPFFYHTTLDWYNKDFDNNFDKYLKYLNKSVEILCKNYGEIGGLWFDGNWSKPEGTDWKEDELYATIRKYQPNAMIINNTGLQKRGEIGNPEIDAVTFEQGRPEPMNREGMPKYLAAEMCGTIGNFWGAGKLDLNIKSPKELIENICLCRKVGANYLLNIGPTAQGGIEPLQGEIMKTVGKWMNIYGEAIYEGKPYPAVSNSKNFILRGNGKLYIFVFNLAGRGSDNVVVGGDYQGATSFNGITDKVKAVKWMDTGEELTFMQDKNMFTFDATGYPYGTATCVRVAEASI